MRAPALVAACVMLMCTAPVPPRSAADVASYARDLCHLAPLLPAAFEPVRRVCASATAAPAEVCDEFEQCLRNFRELTGPAHTPRPAE